MRSAIDRIARHAGAIGVMLFGSRARGDHGPESDYDLCVIVPDEGLRPQSHLLRMHLRGIDAGVDLHVMRIGHFLAHAHVPGWLAHEVAVDGVAVWGSVPEPAAA